MRILSFVYKKKLNEALKLLIFDACNFIVYDSIGFKLSRYAVWGQPNVLNIDFVSSFSDRHCWSVLFSKLDDTEEHFVSWMSSFDIITFHRYREILCFYFFFAREKISSNFCFSGSGCLGSCAAREKLFDP